MLGQSGQGPISEGTGPGRMLAIIAALAMMAAGVWLYVAEPSVTTAAVAPKATLPATNAAVSPPLVRPSPRASYVVDSAKVFSAAAVAELDTLLSELHVGAGPEVVIMTVPTLDGATIDDYARRVATQWSIGDENRKDGVLVLIAPNDRQVRIEVARGLENVLTNARCREIVEQTMLPLFRKGYIERAGIAGVLEIQKTLAANPTLIRQVPAK